MIALAVAGTTLAKRFLERMTDDSFRQWNRWTVMTAGVVYLGAGTWMLAAR